MKWKSLLLTTLVLGIAVGAVNAEPAVKRSNNSFTIVDGVTDAILDQIKGEMDKVDRKKLSFAVKNFKDEDLAKLCAAYPDMDALNIESSKALTSIAPMASLKSFRGFRMSADQVRDLTPLAGLTEMMILSITSKTMGPDLKWMSNMTKLQEISIRAGSSLTSFEGIPSLPAMKRLQITGAYPADLTPLQALPSLTHLDLSYCNILDLSPIGKMQVLDNLNLYGATVKDFSPLADAPRLKKIMYYAVKGADFSTLGKLTQIEELKGGLTELNDIAWVENLQNLKKFDVFSEYVSNYAPLAKTKIEDFQIWSMRVPVNLSTFTGPTSLKKLKLWSLKDVSELGSLSAFVNMENLIIDNINNKGVADIAFIKDMPNLKKLHLSNVSILDTTVLANLSRLDNLDATNLNDKADKPFDLAFLSKMPGLTSLNLSGSTVSNFDAIANCSALKFVRISKTTGITSLEALKKLPNLSYLTVTKETFPEAELTGFSNSKIQITQN